jgi:HEPN domain-containing protein
MKLPDEDLTRLVAEWLEKADADMELVEHLLRDESFPNAIAFNSQQAAEKYLKAFLTANQMDFPKTHDLKELLKLVAKADADLAASLRDTSILTPYGVDLRYPGDRPNATEDDAREAVGLADKVRGAVMKRLNDIV